MENTVETIELVQLDFSIHWALDVASTLRRDQADKRSTCLTLTGQAQEKILLNVTEVREEGTDGSRIIAFKGTMRRVGSAFRACGSCDPATKQGSITLIPLSAP